MGHAAPSLFCLCLTHPLVTRTEGSTYTALGFTYHLKGDFDTAIDYYHKALGLVADDALTTEMLERALKDASAFPV